MVDGQDDEPAHVDIDTEHGQTEEDGDMNPLGGAGRRQERDEAVLEEALSDDSQDLAATIYEHEAEARERLYEGMIGVLLKENKDRFTEKIMQDVDLDDPAQVRHAMSLIEQYSTNADGSFGDVDSFFDGTDLDDIDRFMGDEPEGSYDALVASIEHRYDEEVAGVVDEYIDRTLDGGQKAGRTYLESELEIATARGDEDYVNDLAAALQETREHVGKDQADPARLGEGLRQAIDGYDLRE